MIRLATLIVWLNATQCLLWDVGVHPSGDWMFWGGTLVSFDFGTHCAMTWDDEGVHWCACWVDRQQPWDEYEAWGWYAEGRVGGEMEIVTP
jgi:hypothetical protein